MVAAAAAPFRRSCTVHHTDNGEAADLVAFETAVEVGRSTALHICQTYSHSEADNLLNTADYG